MTSEQTQDTRTAAGVIAQELADTYSEYVLYGMSDDDDWVSDANDVIASLAAAGYTIAGPGSVVVDRERAERMRYALAVLDTALCVGGAEGVSKWGIQPGDLDPLSTQEGE